MLCLLFISAVGSAAMAQSVQEVAYDGSNKPPHAAPG